MFLFIKDLRKVIQKQNTGCLSIISIHYKEHDKTPIDMCGCRFSTSLTWIFNLMHIRKIHEEGHVESRSLQMWYLATYHGYILTFMKSLYSNDIYVTLGASKPELIRPVVMKRRCGPHFRRKAHILGPSFTLNYQTIPIIYI